MVTQGITDTNSQFIAALVRGDAAGCAAVYADDGILLPPRALTCTGRQAIQEFWQDSIDTGITGANRTTVSLEEHGDTAIEVGAYTLDILLPDGDTFQKTDKYVVIWKRQPDGSWKWAIDIFNGDDPPEV